MTSKRHFKKLDAIRGAACLYVLAHNTVYVLYGNGLLPQEAKIFFFAGSEAVMAFFMLSGFLIFYSFRRYSQQDFKTYLSRRFIRIYIPLLISFLVSMAIAQFNGHLQAAFSWRETIGNLILLQDFSQVKPGTWFNPFFGNLPLWSLSYEWWCYILFYPFYRYLPQKTSRLYVVLGFSMLCYLVYVWIPNTASLIGAHLIIWWCGGEVATIFDRDRRFSWNNLRPIFICLTTMTALSFSTVLAAEEIRFGHYPFLIFRHFFSASVACAVGLFWYRKKFAYFDLMFGKFAKLAPISYALYILQFPILFQWNLRPHIPQTWLIVAIKVVVLFALSYLIDVKLQPLVNKWTRSRL